MKKILMLTICFIWFLSHGQKITYYDEITGCTISGMYNDKLYTSSEIINCYLLTQTDSLDIKNIPMIFVPEDIYKYNLQTLEIEYATKLNILNNMSVPKSIFWLSVKEQKTKELKSVYNLCKTTYLGYFDPFELKKYDNLDDELIRISNSIIIGGDSLLDVWISYTMRRNMKNVDSVTVCKIFNKKFNSIDKYTYAKLDLIMFEFWNIANNKIERPSEKQQDSIEIEYEKLFIKIKREGCSDI